MNYKELKESLKVNPDWSKCKNVISHSQFAKYEDCPHQWRLRYIDKERRYDNSIYLVLGNAFHEAHQLLMTGKIRKSQVRDYVFTQIREQPPEDFTDAELKQMKGMATGLLSKVWFEEPPARDLELVEVEKLLYLPVLEGYNVWLLGYIDEVYVDKKGNHILSDMKFTNYGWDKWKKADPVKVGQLQIYKLAYHKVTGIPMREIKIMYDIFQFNHRDWDTDGRSRRSFRPTDTQKVCLFMWKQLERMVKECFHPDGSYNKDKVYPQRPYKKRTCDWCDYNFEAHNCDILTRTTPVK